MTAGPPSACAGGATPPTRESIAGRRGGSERRLGARRLGRTDLVQPEARRFALAGRILDDIEHDPITLPEIVETRRAQLAHMHEDIAPAGLRRDEAEPFL
jgi:hypothetical protein